MSNASREYRLAVGLIVGAVFSAAAGYQINLSSFHVFGEAFSITRSDDVMVTLRVARNIAEGYGPYFNPGQLVQANTSLYWPMLLSPLYWIGSPAQVVGTVEVICWLIWVTVGVLIVWKASSLRSAFLCGVFLVLTPSIYYFLTNGWEQIPQTLFVTLGFLVILKRFPSVDGRGSLPLGVGLLAVAFLLRPDTAVLICLPVAALLWRIWQGEFRADWLDYTGIGFALLALASFVAGQLYFYGSLVPNTYYLKATGGASSLLSGVNYLVETVYEGGNGVFLLAFVVLFIRFFDEHSFEHKLVGTAICAWGGYVVWIGGDVFPGGRFLLAVTPTLILLTAEQVVDFGERFEENDPLAYFSVISVFVFLPLSIGYGVLGKMRIPVYEKGQVRQVMTEPSRTDMRAQVALTPLVKQCVDPENQEVGVFWLGAISYYLPTYTFADFLGLADPVVAKSKVKSDRALIGHNKWNFDHMFSDHNVAFIPFPDRQRDLTYADELDKQGDTSPNFYLLLNYNDTIQSEFTYFSPKEHELNKSWGFFAANEIKDCIDEALAKLDSEQQPGKDK